MNEMKQLLLEAPEGHIAEPALELIIKWDDEPKAIQVLETLDACVQGGLSSGFVIGVLEAVLNSALEKEGMTYEDLIAQAIWRNTLL